MSSWTAPVRYAEIDGQGVVFNAHYLTYCDEAMAHFCRERDLAGFAADVQLVASNLTWTSAARWGDVVEVDVACTRVGRTSLTLCFDIRVGTRACCRVETTYVHIDGAGRPAPVPDEARAALS
jgi:acyl-CoA thioester hydrolase